MDARAFHAVMPTPPQDASVPVWSTSASDVLQALAPAVAALAESGLVTDLTVEGLLHAPELLVILNGGARVLMISNEHPEALERLAPNEGLKDRVRAVLARCREVIKITVTSDAGSDLTENPVAGVWCWTDWSDMVAYWPGGVAVAFPSLHSVNGRLVLAPGVRNVGGGFIPGVGITPFAGMTSLSFGVGGNDFGHGLDSSRRLGTEPEDCNHSHSLSSRSLAGTAL